MSLENNLKRIADSLEIIAQCMSNTATTIPAAPPAPAGEAAPEQPTAPPASQEAPPAPKPEAPAVEVKDAEECNALLIKEYNRLGATPEAMTTIQTVMQNEYGVRSVHEIEPAKFGELVAKVRELQSV